MANFEVENDCRAKLSKNGVLFVNLKRERSDADAERDYKLIANYLKDQTDQCADSNVKPSDIVSSLMLRIEKDLAEEGTVEDYCQYLQGLSGEELAVCDAVQLSNIGYEDNQTLQQVMAKNIKGR